MSRTKKVVIGEEYDESLFAALKQVLLAKRAILIDKSWGIGGSQEISIWRVTIDRQKLVIEAETYMGLSLFGPKDLVSEIALAVAEQVSKSSGTGSAGLLMSESRSATEER